MADDPLIHQLIFTTFHASSFLDDSLKCKRFYLDDLRGLLDVGGVQKHKNKTLK